MKRLTFFLVVIFAFACQHSANPKKFDVTALVGDWKTLYKNPYVLERWTLEGDKMIGTSFEVSANEMKVTETLLLENLRGTKVYTPTVVGQNDGKGIPFTCTFESATRIEFTNQLHDYPQVIRYELLTPDSLNVTVGRYPLDSFSDNMRFYFSRVKNE